MKRNGRGEGKFLQHVLQAPRLTYLEKFNALLRPVL